LGYFYVLLGLGLLVLLAFLLSLRKRLGRRYRLPYVVDEALFPPAQRAFLVVLERAVGRDYRVYGRVRAVDVIGLRRRPRLDRRSRRRALERLWNWHFDFLICSPQTGAILCAVNLAPRSRLRRGPPRNALDQICAAAELPFVRFSEADTYRVAEIAPPIFAAMASRRPPAAKVEVPALPAEVPGELQEVLQGLSNVMVADGRPARVTSLSVVATSGERAVQSVSSVPAAPARREPTLVGDGDVDLGPAFHIDGDLEDDDRPVRVRRS
jgi:hypothetical protein